MFIFYLIFFGSNSIENVFSICMIGCSSKIIMNSELKVFHIGRKRIIGNFITIFINGNYCM